MSMAAKAKEQYDATLTEIEALCTTLQQAQHWEVELKAQFDTTLKEKAKEYNKTLQPHEEQATSCFREQQHHADKALCIEEEDNVATPRAQAEQMARAIKMVEEGFQRLLKATIEDHKQILRDEQERHRQLHNEHNSLLVNSTDATNSCSTSKFTIGCKARKLRRINTNSHVLEMPLRKLSFG